MPKYLRLEDMSLVQQQQGSGNGGVPFQCPMLSPTNYTTWAIKMEAIMDAQGVWESIEPATGVAVDEKKSKKARAFIFQALPDDVILQVAQKKTAKEVWDSLKTRYLGADRVQKARLQTLKSEFDSLRMKEGESVDEFAGKLSGISTSYISLGSKLDDAVLVRKLLDAVPDKFLQLVASMEQYSDIDQMPFEEAIGRLKAYESRLKLRSEVGNNEASLLLTRSEGQNSQKGNGSGSNSTGKGRGSSQSDRGGRNGGRGRGNSRGRGGRGNQNSRDNSGGRWKNRDKKHIKCFNCENYGHYASECPNPKKKEADVNLTQTQEDEPALLLTIGGEDVDEIVLLNEEKVFPAERANEKDTWYLDNGASNHMTGEKSHFAELDERVTGLVRFGDGSRVQIKGKGTILLECKTKEQLVVSDVYFIPALHSNILSLGQMTEEGYRVEMVHEFLRVRDECNRLVMKVERTRNRLYKIALQTSQPACLYASLDNDAWLWHARLGHVNFRILESMATKEMVRGMPRIKHPARVCEGCLVAKQARQSFPKEAQWRASSPLELVHADLCGPIAPQTIAGNHYFLLLVDDFSRYMWVFLLKTKDEAFSAFKEFNTQMEGDGVHRLRTLRTDRGGEFTSQVFEAYCKEKGIRRHLTAPYSPQQNGVVERRNRTVLGVTRSLLKSMDVPDNLWGEAVRHAIQILNRVPTKGVVGMTPFEAMHRKKPILEHFRVFGCVAYAKRTANKLSKLSDRSIALVYLGNEPGSKAYRLYSPSQNRKYVARDVVFDEKAKWKWEETLGAGPVFHPEWIRFPSDEPDEAQQEPNEQAQDWSPVGHTQTPNTPTTPITEAHSSEYNQSSGSFQTSGAVPLSPQSALGNFSSTYDQTPVRGFRSLDDVLSRCEPLGDEPDELMLAGEEPTTYSEALTDKEWRAAMKKELESVEKNNTWKLTILPKGRKPIGLKWVYKLKKDAEGKIVKHKARIVAKGYVQQKGVDFDDAFAPVARLETVRLLLSLAANEGWKVHHLDVKSAFLNGELNEEVYVCQPDGFVVAGKEHMVYRLNKALYGLRQAPRAWNVRLDKTLKQLGFQRCPQEHAVYKRKKPNSLLIVGVYVDDLIVTGTSEQEVEFFKKQMKQDFDMSDLGELSFYLGIEVQQSKDKFTISQGGYAKRILQVAGMEDCNPAKYPMEPKMPLTKDEGGVPVNATKYRCLVGSLRYLTHSRPDLSYSVGIVSRYMETPKESHLKAVKHILRYIKGTVDYGLVYRKGGSGKLVGFSDSSHGMDLDDRKGTTGTVFYFSGSPITWSSQKQQTVALSSCEAEFMAATVAACQALWLRSLLKELTGWKADQVKLFVDNKSAIALMQNPVFHGRSKHIDTRFHFIRDCIEKNLITVEHVSGEEQRADPLTKALPRVKFLEMRDLLGVERIQN
ncbi:hypothetical protein L1887_09191 [Cichorium endivia]|nr:hypothetical protein L1887_34512 [Cichorium endivia]KAI3519971.1 hypothetical protein L1887_09191 [Cichorium endivia]